MSPAIHKIAVACRAGENIVLHLIASKLPNCFFPSSSKKNLELACVTAYIMSGKQAKTVTPITTVINKTFCHIENFAVLQFRN